MDGREVEAQFAVPAWREGVSVEANIVLQLGAMAGRLALEKRTLVDHIDGRAENVAEHTHMLSRIAPILAMRLYPSLDPALVALLAGVHDDLEAYVGDTPTHSITSEEMEEKRSRERRGLAMLCVEYAHIPEYVRHVLMYEAQEVPEARFVRVLDKLMPLTVHFNQGGVTLTANWTRETMIQNAEDKARELLEEYPDFAELIAIRTELAELAAKELFPHEESGDKADLTPL
jgi:5'-deoxynucleotidase YfbR-like HD superfamily hydrolase